MATQIGPTRIHIERKSLEDIYKSLQCFRCFDIPSITKERRNRYSCIKNSHQLCEKCKTECKCGSTVVDSLNPSIHGILEDLPIYCANFNAGCREIYVQAKAEDLEAHQLSCIFRKVYCPGCLFNVIFKDVSQHLTTCPHFAQSDSLVQVSINTERKKQCVIYLPILYDQGGRSGLDGNARKIELINGVDFYLVGEEEEGICYFWIYFHGSPLEAKNYAYTFTVKGQDGTKISFYGYVIPLDEDSYVIIEKKAVFTIKGEAMKSFGNEDSKLPIEVTIHALKEEAKDDDLESGVSTDESDN